MLKYMISYSDLPSEINNPMMDKMTAIIDPLSYKDRLTMPILSITATGDEFFAPDDTYLYFDQLLGPKYLRILPNIEHTTLGCVHL